MLDQAYLAEPTIQYMVASSIPKTTEPIRYIDLVRKGLTGNHLANIREKTGLELQHLATIAQVTTRTLINKKAEEPLGLTVSEKLLSLVRLFARGKEVFGTDSAFKQWLLAPIPVFNNETPISQLDTVFGFELVSDVIGRIEHGVLS